MNMKLNRPYVRSPAKRSFENLLNTELQKKWFDPNYKHSFWDSLEYFVFDYLLNIEWILDEPEKAIGEYFYDKEEAEIISSYLNFYNDTFEGEMPDNYYVNHPEWPKVIEGAKKIVEMMEKNNKKYDLDKDMDLWDDEVTPML